MVRKLMAALAAGIASALIPFALAVWGFAEGSGSGLGPSDDAPFRASAVLLFLTPGIVILGTMWYLVATWALRRYWKLEFRNLMVLSLLASMVYGLNMAIQGYGVGGASDAAISFAIFGLEGLLCLSLGACVWWLLRPVT